MGGDHGPAVTVPAALAALRSQSDLNLVLVGQRAVLERNSRVMPAQIAVASGFRKPPRSLAWMSRRRRHARQERLINACGHQPREKRRGQAIVSAGNTGALMATARFVLKTLPGIDRPAIITAFQPSRPCTHSRSGRHVDSSPEQLLQFGIMGSLLVGAVERKERPLVALLNVGVEDIKGNEVVKKADELFRRATSTTTATSRVTKSISGKWMSSCAMVSLVTSR